MLGWDFWISSIKDSGMEIRMDEIRELLEFDLSHSGYSVENF